MSRGLIYDTILKELDIEKGDIVKVTHKVPNSDLGWNDCWSPSMDVAIGKTFKVDAINEDRMGVSLEGIMFAYPPQSLKVLSRVRRSIKVPISSDYTAYIYPGTRIEVGCQTITPETLEKIYKAFHSDK